MDSPPFFGVDEQACDPAYEPKENGSRQIREGSRLIIDIAGRLPEEDAVYYDVSWCMNVGEKIDPEYEKWFQIVYDAREDARQFIQARLDAGEKVSRVVCDYIAGMSDIYAIDQFEKLFVPKRWNV